DEGSNHEAIAVAGRYGLANLTTVVVDNASSQLGWPGGSGSRFEIEGWQARSVHGRDHDTLHTAFTSPHPGRPLAVVVTTAPCLSEKHGHACSLHRHDGRLDHARDLRHHGRGSPRQPSPHRD